MKSVANTSTHTLENGTFTNWCALERKDRHQDKLYFRGLHNANVPGILNCLNVFSTPHLIVRRCEWSVCFSAFGIAHKHFSRVLYVCAHASDINIDIFTYSLVLA